MVKKIVNLTIRTYTEYKDELVELLKEKCPNLGKLQWENEGFQTGKYKYYFDNFGLYPFEEQDWIKNRWVLNIPFETNHKYILQLSDKITPVKGQIQCFRYKYQNKDDDEKNVKQVIEKYVFKYPSEIPKYPIYVVSYKRSHLRGGTIDHLEKMGLKYYVCIQKRERQYYEEARTKNNWTGCTLLYSCDTDDGSTQQRNTCWEHSLGISNKFWLLDDNIAGWCYYNLMNIVKIHDPRVFTELEKLIDNILEPVGLISHNYTFDVRETNMRSPIQINTKNYSSCLINTKLLGDDIRFRLKYNEDVDLTLQILKRGYKTISMNIFTCNKNPTTANSGGNSDIYGNGTKFQEKYDCLKNHWDQEDQRISQFINQRIKHKDKRVHLEVDYKQLCKLLDNTKDITPLQNMSQKSYQELGIEIVYKNL